MNCSKGMVTANGNYVTKQSGGIYSTEPPAKRFQPKDPATYQAAINVAKGPEVVETTSGKVRRGATRDLYQRGAL